MKTTRKEYLSKYEEMKNLKIVEQEAERNEDWSMYFVIETSIKELKSDYFDKLNTVSVSYYIGSRSYYEDVVKIGKSYFKNGHAMTKGRGYYCISEIEEITDKMTTSMMADAYWY